MIGNLKPYPEYKESGVPWLGRIPAHWSLERAKWLFHKMDRPSRAEDHVVTCFRDGVVTLRKNRRLRGFTESLKEIGYQGIRRGDLVIHAMDAFAGAVGVSDSDGKGTPVYSVCQPEPDASPHYYAQVVREMARSQWILALSKGIRERSTDFRFETFGRQVVPTPPEDEQYAIARFFTAVDAQCRRLTRTKRKVIALLNEQKQAIIHRAVTRGLDPNVRLKPSGIPWLGDVPVHWELRRLGQIASVFNGTTPSRAQPGFWENGTVPWLASGTVNEYVVTEASEFVTERALNECALSVVPSGAVILGLVGQGRTRGMSARLAIDACINQNLAAIVPKAHLRGDYLHYFLTAHYPTLREYGRGGNQEALNCAIVARLRVPIPPSADQERLCNYLAARLADELRSEDSLKREINLAQEYRTRLIADVVTGQLDVREAARNFPEDVGEPDAVDAEDKPEESEELVEADANHE